MKPEAAKLLATIDRYAITAAFCLACKRVLPIGQLNCPVHRTTSKAA